MTWGRFDWLHTQTNQRVILYINTVSKYLLPVKENKHRHTNQKLIFNVLDSSKSLRVRQIQTKNTEVFIFPNNGITMKLESIIWDHLVGNSHSVC